MTTPLSRAAIRTMCRRTVYMREPPPTDRMHTHTHMRTPGGFSDDSPPHDHIPTEIPALHRTTTSRRGPKRHTPTTLARASSTTYTAPLPPPTCLYAHAPQLWNTLCRRPTTVEHALHNPSKSRSISETLSRRRDSEQRHLLLARAVACDTNTTATRIPPDQHHNDRSIVNTCTSSAL